MICPIYSARDGLRKSYGSCRTFLLLQRAESGCCITAKHGDFVGRSRGPIGRRSLSERAFMNIGMTRRTCDSSDLQTAATGSIGGSIMCRTALYSSRTNSVTY